MPTHPDANRELIAELHATEEAAGRYGYGYPVCMTALEAMNADRAAVLFPGYSNQAGLLLAEAINTGRDQLGREADQIVEDLVRRGYDRLTVNHTIDSLVCLNSQAKAVVEGLLATAATARARRAAERAPVARAA